MCKDANRVTLEAVDASADPDRPDTGQHRASVGRYEHSQAHEEHGNPRHIGTDTRRCAHVGEHVVKAVQAHVHRAEERDEDAEEGRVRSQFDRRTYGQVPDEERSEGVDDRPKKHGK